MLGSNPSVVSNFPKMIHKIFIIKLHEKTNPNSVLKKVSYLSKQRFEDEKILGNSNSKKNR